jgi:hypothetical protein
MPNIKMVLLTTNDYRTDLNSALELNNTPKKQFHIGTLGHYEEEIAALKKAGVDFIYDHYTFMGKEFALEFLEFIPDKK